MHGSEPGLYLERAWFESQHGATSGKASILSEPQSHLPGTMLAAPPGCGEGAARPMVPGTQHSVSANCCG